MYLPALAGMVLLVVFITWILIRKVKGGSFMMK